MRIYYNSIEEYLNFIRSDASLEIMPVTVIPPIGPAADRYLWEGICECCVHPTNIVSFTAPCIREEKIEDIRNGSHLSLFFLMMIIIGTEVDMARRDEIFSKITGVTSFGMERVLSQTCRAFSSDGFIFRQKYVPPARGFDCTGYAYEMFDKDEIEICNLACFQHNQSKKQCYVMAFGIERMIMHIQGEINVWNTTPFTKMMDLYCGCDECDKQRRQIFNALLHETPEKCISPQVMMTYPFIQGKK